MPQVAREKHHRHAPAPELALDGVSTRKRARERLAELIHGQTLQPAG
ncbi:hypothetical protein [Pseudogemmatithrix spongiicola]